MTGALVEEMAKGSKEANAPAKPPIVPFAIRLTERGARAGLLGFTFCITSSDQDFGRGMAVRC